MGRLSGLFDLDTSCPTLVLTIVLDILLSSKICATLEILISKVVVLVRGAAWPLLAGSGAIFGTFSRESKVLPNSIQIIGFLLVTRRAMSALKVGVLGI